MANFTTEQREKNKKVYDFEIARDISSKVKLDLSNNKLELNNISQEDFKKIQFGYDMAIKFAITALNNVIAKYEVR